jgi:iron(III) transport system ATP-binding protein
MESSGPVMLEVKGLSKRFGGVTAVSEVSFLVRQGEVVTLLGPSGCGKTTTLRMVAGLERPDEGEIEIQGRVVFSAKDRIFVPPEKRGLGMVFQSYAIWPMSDTLWSCARSKATKSVGQSPKPSTSSG